jgi:putative glycosyltransferase (TIGR04372 family)
MAHFPLSWLQALLFLIAGLVRPFGRLRIGLLHHRSLGRLCANTEYYFRRTVFEKPPCLEFPILVSGTPVNRQILKMIARHGRVIESDRLWALLDAVRRRSSDSSLWINLSRTGYFDWQAWIAPGSQLAFTPDEHVRGRALLRAMGIPEGASYVCFCARDKTYTDSPDFVRPPDVHWSYNDFRDCDIATYLPAVEQLVEQGLWAVCTDRTAERPLAITAQRIIDYTCDVRPHQDNPDFADVYLQAHCKFFLGCGKGTYLFSSIFDVPFAFANAVPLGEVGRMPHDGAIPKKYRDVASGELVPFRYLIERGADTDRLTYQQLDALVADGIEIVDNTADEIREFTMEMNDRLDGIWEADADDQELQDRYRALFPPDHPVSDIPSWIGAAFLRRHRDLLG